MHAATLDLVFDGQCGFCTHAVGWIKRLDTRGRIRVHPFQQSGVRQRFALSEEETRSAAWAISRNGRVPGAGSINLALDVALGTRMFSAAYRVPGVRWLQDRAYAWIASHRYLLRGATPWCTVHPDECDLAIEGATCSIAPSTDSPRGCAL